MSIFRFSAEFRFFSGFPRFLKWFSAFFEQSPKQKKKKPVSDSATIVRVRRASVNSRWRLRLPVYASSVSGQSSKASHQHSAPKLAAGWLEEGAGVSTRGRFDLWLVAASRGGRVVLKWRDGGRLEGIARVLSWPVNFGHWTSAFGQNDREKACHV